MPFYELFRHIEPFVHDLGIIISSKKHSFLVSRKLTPSLAENVTFLFADQFSIILFKNLAGKNYLTAVLYHCKHIGIHIIHNVSKRASSAFSMFSRSPSMEHTRKYVCQT